MSLLPEIARYRPARSPFGSRRQGQVVLAQRSDGAEYSGIFFASLCAGRRRGDFAHRKPQRRSSMPSLLKLVSFVAVVMSLSNAAFATDEVTVPCPSGMVDSSSAIATALQSLAPGGTVHLEACTYYLADPVVVTGSFHGALRGEGVGQTVLTTFPDEDGIEDVLMVNWISIWTTQARGDPRSDQPSSTSRYSVRGRTGWPCRTSRWTSRTSTPRSARPARHGSATRCSPSSRWRASK